MDCTQKISDERLKEFFGESAPLDAFSKINAYLYKYRPEARQIYGDTHGVDDNTHVGVMAQELQENPLTSDSVIEDENGYLSVDTDRLCLTLAAVVADLSKRVIELETLTKQKSEKAVEK